MRKVCFIADFFAEHILGGGELNNEELILILKSKGYEVEKIQSHLVDEKYLNDNGQSFFIIANFCNLPKHCFEILQILNYIIYEHDHKYLKSRNPATYKDFKAPTTEVVNFHFYKNAKAVLCQSNFHRDIIKLNIDLDNIFSVGGNLWSLDVLEQLRKISKITKKDKCSVLNSNIEHKNTHKTVKYCIKKNIDYELVADSNYINFLKKLGANKKFIFLPQTPETLSRVAVEARMMGVSVTTNNLVGATSEEWFGLKGEELIDYMINKRQEIFSFIEKKINSISPAKRENKKISILSTFHDGEKYLDHFLKDITRQTIFGECELIFVDANSQGEEKKIIQEYENKYDNIIYYRLPYKAKPTDCLNIGIRKSSGKYLTFGFIDDRRKKDCLEILFKNIEKDDTIDLVYGDCLQTSSPNEVFENSTSDGTLFEHSRYDFSPENMIKCLPGPMPMWKKSMHDRCGFFDEEGCNFADDWEMWLRAVHNGSKFKKVNDTLGLYLIGGRSQQEHNLEQRKEEAKIFHKYSHIFGRNFDKFKPYFDQFLAQ